MKVFAVVLLFAALACADDKMVGSSYGGSAPAPSYGGGGGSSYGGGSAPASIPAPPCAKNYLFSCQPNLQPVPCSSPAPSSGYGSAPSGGYGSSGAYSFNYPTYAVPQFDVNALYNY